MYWLHVCRGLVSCHGQDFLAPVERQDAHCTFVMDCVLPLMADEDNEKDEQVAWDTELLLDCDELSLHELAFVDSLLSIVGIWQSGTLFRGCGACPPEISVRASVAFAMLLEIVYAQAGLALSCEGSFMHPVQLESTCLETTRLV